MKVELAETRGRGPLGNNSHFEFNINHKGIRGFPVPVNQDDETFVVEEENWRTSSIEHRNWV